MSFMEGQIYAPYKPNCDDSLIKYVIKIFIKKNFIYKQVFISTWSSINDVTFYNILYTFSPNDTFFITKAQSTIVTLTPTLP